MSDPIGIDPEIRDAIIKAPAMDPRKLAAQLTSQFGRVIPSTLVVQIRGSMSRAVNVSNARERASTTLDENLDIMGDAKRKLLEIFHDESIPLKMRLEVSKELRQWTGMESDAAGIKDSDTNTVFIIDSQWNVDRVEGTIDV